MNFELEISGGMIGNIIANNEIRQPYEGAYPQIRFGDRWLTIARTDYIDNVCTYMPDTIGMSDDKIREYWLGRITDLGARVGDHVFAIIDSISDG